MRRDVRREACEKKAFFWAVALPWNLPLGPLEIHLTKNAAHHNARTTHEQRHR